MPGPRSKRKRTEIDSTSATPPPTRRRGREVSTGAEPTAAAAPDEDKNKSISDMSTKGASEDTAAQRDPDSEQPTSEGIEPAETKDVAVGKSGNSTKADSEAGNDHAEENDGASSAIKTPATSLTDQIANEGDQAEKRPQNAATAMSRGVKVEELLSHRRMLIRRLQGGRSAAQKRLDLLFEKQPERKDENDDEEIAAFREMSRVATSVARKHSRVESSDAPGAPGEMKRTTSLSLRRGSSVGKRMNAALSSLAPGAAAAAMASAETGPVTDQQKSPSAAALASKNASISTTGPGKQQSANIPEQKGTGPGRPPSVGPRKDNTKIEQGMQAPARSLSQKLAAQVGPRVIPSTNRTGLPKTGRQKSSTMVGNSGIPPIQTLKPIVVCPEAVALRDRRKVLEEKLSNLLQDRLQRIRQDDEQKRSPMKGKVDGIPIAPLGQSSPHSPPRREVPLEELQEALRGPGQPVPLPNRRRTQWDTVLDEMRWLATDFIEERKWKVCASRTVAQAALSSSIVKVDVLQTSSKTIVHSSNDVSRETSDEEVVTESTTEDAATTIRSYPEVSPEDEAHSKTVSSILSNMILELSTTIETVGFTSLAGGEYAKSLDRHLQTRKNLESDSGPVQDDEEDPSSHHGNAMDTDEEPESKENVPLQEGDDTGKTFDRISKFVDDVLLKVSKPGSKSKTASLALGEMGLEPTENQRKVIERINDLWSRAGSGALLGGPRSSGKTISACSLLWNKKADGPQLVVCAPSCMVRWMHEISRFDGLRVQVEGSDCGISAPFLHLRSAGTYGPGDVVVCGFSSLRELGAKKLSRFKSVVLDARYPNGFAGSRSPVHGEEGPGGSNCVQGTESPAELLKSSWWELVASAPAENRLMIDNLPPNDSARYITGVSDRELLEVLGLRIAFLFGASNFRTTFYSLPKSLLAWARRKIKGKDVKGTKFDRVKNLFLGLATDLFCRLDGLSEGSSPEPTTVSWDTHLCKMPESQRSAYNKACWESRAALSTVLEPQRQMPHGQVNPFESIAEVLLKMRRLCMHANARTLLFDALVRDGCSLRCFQEELGCPSQPNIELANRILAGSAKLTELLSLLIRECDMKLPEGVPSPVLSLNNISKGKEEGGGKRKRVAILASLPEAQMLASLLLNSVGINHELLLRPDSVEDDAGADESTLFSRPLAWIHSQMVLSSFNGGFHVRGNEKKSDLIIIASPETVGGDHCGLGIESADIILCLDDDWSGRGELQLASLVLRCLSRNRALRDDHCKFIRLVTSDSCEANFLAKRKPRPKASQSNISVWPWPIDATGSFSAPLSLSHSKDSEFLEAWQSKQSGTGQFTFPARNIVAMRGMDLSDVLSPGKHLPPLLTTSAELLFLPTEKPEDDLDVEIDLVASLMKIESDASSRLVWHLGVHHEVSTSWSTIRPPHPVDFPHGILGRLDLPVAPSRIHLYRMKKEYAHLQSRAAAEAPAGNLPANLVLGSPSRRVNGETGDSFWQLGEPSKSPDEVIENLLFYGGDPAYSSAAHKRRSNCYASAFSRLNPSCFTDNGNAEFEPLVYLPPIFPRALECSQLAQAAIEDIRKKRKDGSTVTQESKRPREDSDVVMSELAPDDADASRLTPNQKLSLAPDSSDAGVITEDEEPAGPASTLLALDDDYGLIGIGALPFLRDSALDSAACSVRVTDFRSDGMWAAGRLPCDSEELQKQNQSSSGGSLDSVILLVSRKRPRGFAGRFIHGAPATPSTVPGQAAANDLYYESNGALKKTKKKLGAGQKDVSPGGSAFNRLVSADGFRGSLPSGQMPANTPPAKARDLFKTRVLMMSRLSGTGSTLFEAPAFRAASVRVRNRVTERLIRHGWTSSTAYEVGPGLPLVVAKRKHSGSAQESYRPSTVSWTSIVKQQRSNESFPGQEATELSIAQKAALRRSCVAPCRVDFGPFQVGFLSSPSGMTSAPPIRGQLGISLPLGVKLQVPRDPDPTPWSDREDKLLLKCFERFGANWTLTARVLSGFHYTVSCSVAKRAARSCRDRWQNHVRPQMTKSVKSMESSDSLGNQETDNDEDMPDIGMKAKEDDDEVRRTEGDARHGVFLSRVPTRIADQSGKDEIQEVASDKDGAETTDADDPPKASAKPKRSFGFMSAAKEKKRSFPMTIPGAGSGGTPTAVPSHPSHMQAVQTSIAASWTRGRTEMWPLQLLDAADRHRNAAAAASAVPTKAPNKRSPSVSSTAKRQPSVSSNSRVAPVTSSRAPSTAPVKPVVAQSGSQTSKTLTSSNSPASARAAPTRPMSAAPAAPTKQPPSAPSSSATTMPPSSSTGTSSAAQAKPLAGSTATEDSTSPKPDTTSTTPTKDPPSSS